MLDYYSMISGEWQPFFPVQKKWTHEEMALALGLYFQLDHFIPAAPTGYLSLKEREDLQLQRHSLNLYGV